VRKPEAAKKAVYILEPEEIARLRAALQGAIRTVAG
jgi:hypothetical protein